ncbi:MAG TPA: hypothetical protein VM533_07340 [Fimbriiglobus sp.]|jgi:hypothetical protein|nr:hypothetical protein [Fimbriiglobus sp.]
MSRFLVLAAAVAVASTVGCANARYVQKIDNEGVVAVPANSDAWPSYNRTNALKLIEQHIGPAYEIVEEREIKTGTATSNVQNTTSEQTINSEVPFLPAEKQTTTTTTTAQDLTEYHIHYRRKAGGLTGFPGTTPATAVAPAGGMAPAASGVVPAVHTQASPAPAGAAMPPTPTPAGALPPPDMNGVGLK